MDIFSWSIPFVSEKILESLYFILNMNVDDVAIIDPARNDNLREIGLSTAETSQCSSVSSVETITTD